MPDGGTAFLNMPQSQLNFFSPEVRQDPYPFYEKLRHDAPVMNLPGFGWVISRYDEAAFVLGNPDVFSSSIMAVADHVLVGCDPPDHTGHRAIVTRAFSSERIRSLDAGIRSLTDLLVGRIESMDRWDLMGDLALPLPIMLIAEILGIPPERHQEFKSWADAMSTGSGIGPGGPQSGASRSLREMDTFFREVIESRRAQPGNDLISGLLHPSSEDNALTPDQVLSFAKLLLVAGSETTTNLIGNTVMALLRNPGEFAKLRDDPALLPGAIEETLRYDAPVQFVVRQTTRSTTLAGNDIPAGARVMALLGSANRDESRFDDADRFDIGRKPQANLAFGFGPHYCLGATLARMEAASALGRVLPMLDGFRVAGDLSRIPLVQSMQLRGPSSLPFIRANP